MRQSCLTIENLSMLTFANKKLQLNDKLNDGGVKDEDIGMMEEYL